MARCEGEGNVVGLQERGDAGGCLARAACEEDRHGKIEVRILERLKLWVSCDICWSTWRMSDYAAFVEGGLKSYLRHGFV